ncbi:1-deoxy-D-xylulose-5-phosphate synthase [Ruminiclostridium sufflavum DSM 19573]|uniref:1-deoxy-D-xylulose-5-phosphate synthase n=1 Tax=Ruminiclostridium sufflavum DSM 19573 TaxID=1121337 RepID=A0A318XI11_9FIRM|nr:1-deoxy-D-xylulose-5-phosphate synthase [Ruminiclostridium sufflavum]PYG86825.1 1-deoxy-D-xylulose-5-phosphate synthase [Ruminiclostridium sufflavum DSM 19573]
MGYLDNISSPEDVKKLNNEQLSCLAEEIRTFLINKVSKTGGHLAPNLGVVELTLAIHKNFNTEYDKIVWDVGHQSYVHKILTGRKDKFDTLRKLGGLAGFPKTCESRHDCFNTGHSSTSISAALGIARARDLKKENYSVAAVIGDGAMTGGMAYEALNDGGRLNSNFIVILNDNEMSISHNVGGMSKYLSRLRTDPVYTKAKEDVDNFLDRMPNFSKKARAAAVKIKGTVKYLFAQGVFFEQLGYKYYGPVDGHNFEELNKALIAAKKIKGPVLVHVSTQKGKGYSFAEESPDRFHGIAPFEIETGETFGLNEPDYSKIFGDAACDFAKENDRIVAISAAMAKGTGLYRFSTEFSQRFFDVGIAEQHAVTLAAGMSISGMIPIVAIYSSFLQRAYDQIVHDVAIQKLHVVFAIDRSGIVGEDGETHQGIFDISFLNHIPNLTIMAPADYYELRQMLDFAVNKQNGPVAIRYPRGRGKAILAKEYPLKKGKGAVIREGRDVCILAVGSMVSTAAAAAEILEGKGVSAEVVSARFVKPVDEQLIIECANRFKCIVTMEDNCKTGGFGSRVLDVLNENGLKTDLYIMALPDEFITHGSRNELLKQSGLDSASAADAILKKMNNIHI